MSDYGECPYLRKECLGGKCIYNDSYGECSLQTCSNCSYEHNNTCTFHMHDWVGSDNWCQDGDFIEEPYGKWNDKWIKELEE